MFWLILFRRAKSTKNGFARNSKVSGDQVTIGNDPPDCLGRPETSENATNSELENFGISDLEILCFVKVMQLRASPAELTK